MSISPENKPLPRTNYIIGYGSLVQRESRTRTVPSAVAAPPVIVKGISRGWYYQSPGTGLSPTYLGAIADPNATTNGVIYPVTDAEFAANNARETDYIPTQIDRSTITMLDGSTSPPEGNFWFYAVKSKKNLTNATHPIVQSYVDICIDGCLEIEALYPLARDAKFAETFIKTCTDWKTPWINDRIYPYRPFIYVPRAAKIDELLAKYLPEGLFSNITVG